ncbi:hypothetical protein CG740_23150 [Streptomyces sp. CB01201]|uniref:hypothetical protein n=1 Tax=Streptomyces sp. CB01201 TaxID=2020324 RepID=UPI000C27247B|nr:hypothetical protein [Streptomyces sp. CB01201]PJN00806.1 hypothetical protein CG740_23150 [Streptomyces sp. CB01201]
MTTPASGLACIRCGAPPVVHWTRRLTDDEFAAFVALEQARRDLATALADPQGPPPDFGPLPVESDNARSVYACIDHSISLDAAALVHAKTCTAPPCNCTPEPAPQPEPAPDPVELPPGWSDA